MTVRKKYTIEYVLNSSPDFLYTYITTPTGLATWFADNVTILDDIYTFSWEGSEEKAKLLSKRQGKHAKFQWIERQGNETFSFEIVLDDLTQDVSLLISDFEDDDMQDEAKLIYDVCIRRLKSTIGG